MNDPQILIQDSFEKINNAMQSGKWSEAYQACLEILRYDSENHQALKLKNKIEKEVGKLNREAIKKDMSMLKQLWQEKKYEELFGELQKLKAFFPEYPELADLYQKVQKAYQRNVGQEQKKQYRDQLISIQQLASAGNFAGAIQQATALQIPNFKDKKIDNLIQQLQNKWIKAELEKNKILLVSDKFEEKLLFLQSLKHIDQKSKLLEKYIQKTKMDYQAYKIESKKEFIYQASENIRTLYQLKKYDKVIQACHEVLEINPSHHEIKSFLRRAEKKLRRQIEREVIIQILAGQKRNFAELKADSKNFEKI